MEMPQAHLCLLLMCMVQAAVVVSGRQLCHPGKGLHQPCKQATTSECDTCQGLKCTDGYCGGPPPSQQTAGLSGFGFPTSVAQCHAGKGLHEPCKQASISECDTCQGLKCTDGYCGGPPLNPQTGSSPSTSVSATKCHAGKGLHQPCKQATISECDTCQGLKCTNGYCGAPPSNNVVPPTTPGEMARRDFIFLCTGPTGAHAIALALHVGGQLISRLSSNRLTAKGHPSIITCQPPPRLTAGAMTRRQ